MTEQIENDIAPATFDLDAWIDGTCGLTHLAVIYQKGDLLAELDRLQRKIDAAKTVSDKDRGVTDGGVDELITQYEEIAEQWVVSPATVRTHVSRAMTKLDARDRAQLVVIAYQNGLVQSG